MVYIIFVAAPCTFQRSEAPFLLFVICSHIATNHDWTAPGSFPRFVTTLVPPKPARIRDEKKKDTMTANETPMAPILYGQFVQIDSAASANNVPRHHQTVPYDEMDSGTIVREFAVDYDRLQKDATAALLRLRTTLVGMMASSSLLTLILVPALMSGDDDVDDTITLIFLVVVVVVGWVVITISWNARLRRLNNSIKNMYNQHVTLTTTGIRYEVHNCPHGGLFHTTVHVSFIRGSGWRGVFPLFPFSRVMQPHQ
jgi:hypothetical protein